MAATNELGTKKIGSLLLSLAVPAIIAMLVSLLYNMVDRIYIGNMQNGTIGMAGLAVAVPIITLVEKGRSKLKKLSGEVYGSV